LKPLCRVLTHVGEVTCSNEHSLIKDTLECVKPCFLKLKDKLLIHNLPLPDDTPKEPRYPNNLTVEKIRAYKIADERSELISAKMAFIWGLFYADGSCGIYKRKSGNSTVSTWYKLVAVQWSRKDAGTITSFVKKYRDLFYGSRKYKRVPNVILNSSFAIREAFFMGYYAGDGSKKDPALTITNKGAIGSAGLFFLMQSLGYKVSINTRKDKFDTYKLTGSSPVQKFRKSPCAIKKLNTSVELKGEKYIYDMETGNHHFSAGVGQLIVHNSNYIQFPHLTNATETWDYSIEVANKITKLFPPPICLEFEEEIYAFFLILSKKRYMYRKCLRDGIVDTKIGKKGVLLARRDNSKFIRDVYEGVVSMIASHKSSEDVIYFVLDHLNKMCSGSKPYTDFVVTKSIGNHGGLVAQPIKEKPGKAMVGDYTVPLLSRDKAKREEQLKKKKAVTPAEFYLLCLPAQVQLAERMRRRGKRVDPGTRLEYVVTNPDKHTAKQYEKIESAEYMSRHRDVIRIDYMYYLKALVNPLDQVLDVAFKDDKRFKSGFTMSQYKYRWKLHTKLMQKIKSLGNPKLEFIG